MKTLKDLLKMTLAEEKDAHYREIRAIENAQKQAYFFIKDSASYIVEIDSAWAGDGETNIRTEYIGKLQDAVSLAKEKFTETNTRPDVQGEITVKVKLADREFVVPKHYWE